MQNIGPDFRKEWRLNLRSLTTHTRSQMTDDAAVSKVSLPESGWLYACSRGLRDCRCRLIGAIRPCHAVQNFPNFLRLLIEKYGQAQRCFGRVGIQAKVDLNRDIGDFLIVAEIAQIIV